MIVLPRYSVKRNDPAYLLFEQLVGVWCQKRILVTADYGAAFIADGIVKALPVRMKRNSERFENEPRDVRQIDDSFPEPLEYFAVAGKIYEVDGHFLNGRNTQRFPRPVRRIDQHELLVQMQRRQEETTAGMRDHDVGLLSISDNFKASLFQLSHKCPAVVIAFADAI